MAPLIVIVGETASGKSALGLQLAEAHNGEIICADSRTVYKGMDIGTAKPSIEERARIPHHLLDLIEPNQKFTAGQFKNLADSTIKEIADRGKVPIMVGGTGLYVDAVIYNYQFSSPEEAALRDLQNPRHLLKSPQANRNLRPNTVILGLQVEREVLKERIKSRVQLMIDKGLEKEVRQLAEKYGWDSEALTGIGYREWREYFTDAQTLDQTTDLITKRTIDYAKRQRTWFKRNNSIHWLSNRDNIEAIVTTFLNKTAVV